MDVAEVKEGVVVGGDRWHEPVLIQKVTHMGSDVHIVGSTISTGSHITAILSADELRDVRLQQIACDLSSDAWKIFLAVETIRYRFASDYDPWLAMNISKIVPLPHQIEAVYGTVLKMPRVRYVLAHDPGAGKTIMAGLILKELKLRHLITKILIVTPGHLKNQWKRELREKFDEEFVVVDRGIISSMHGQNVWAYKNQLITSMDFAKRDDVRSTLDAAEFDLVIVDEAHKMAANLYGDQIKKTDRYKLGETLSKNTEHCLFLTATPHKGDPDNFRLFLDLLEPGFFATTGMLKKSIEEQENMLFLRRIKEEMKDFEGKALFLPRYVETPSYTLSASERDLYRNVTDYVKIQYNKALTAGRKRSVGFALLILQRRFASSCHALCISLTRRKDRLQKLLDTNEDVPLPTNIHFDINADEMDEMPEDERWQHEEHAEKIVIAPNRYELKREVETLEKLILQAKNIIEQGDEVKLKKLKEVMNLLEEKSINKKILIFTESKDTLDYLEQKIKCWGYTVNHIDGNMDHKERVAAEHIFRAADTQVMVATEAAGEGINLQFCHLMINYDIPWTPTRLEQRMGRIHRYGQKYNVHVYNLIVEDTVEGRIFKTLFDKLKEIKKRMGNDKVYDIIGEIYRDKDLASALADAAVGAKSEAEILSVLETKADKALDVVRDSLNDTLLQKHIEFTALKKQKQRAHENRLMPEYTRDFFLKAFVKAGGNIKEKKSGIYAVNSIPYPIKRVADGNDFKQSHGIILKSYSKVAFTKHTEPMEQDVECLTFGHPLFEAVLEWAAESFKPDLQKGAVFIDPSGHLDGMILFYEGKVTDGSGNVAGKRLLAYYINQGGDIEAVPPSILWDLQESTPGSEAIDRKKLEIKPVSEINRALKEYQQELLRERCRQASIKTKYGLKSLDILIADLDQALVKLKRRKAQGEAGLELNIWNKSQRQLTYKDKRQELAASISRETTLTRNAPQLLGLVRVRSPATIDDSLSENADVETAAMQFAMDYERSHGRTPQDVSNVLGPGYDIRSEDIDGNMRYIEVKGRAKTGRIALTKNEWFKAKHLERDYYLYVVWNTNNTHNPAELKIVRNPANNLHASEDVCYFISQQEIEAKCDG